jgi:hypothetical protein
MTQADVGRVKGSGESTRWRFSSEIARDAIIGALIFAASAVWASACYARFVARGGHPFFYQSYFEPAVMTACGRGFAIAQPQPAPPALRAFLAEQTDRFSCAELPADLQVGTTGLYQRPWRYLFATVGLAWKLVGISWSGLAPLFGVLFGATTAAAFALCRQIAGPAPAVLCAAALAVSRLQLANLPNLRDYAKAPFTVALLVILVALVATRRRPRELLLLAACYGLVLGVGYGFRTDLLVDLPPFVIAVALFLPDGLVENLALKAAAIACCAAGFVAAGWPIITSTAASGGCQWHFVLLGLTTPFNAPLGVYGGAYGWGHMYKDEYVWATVSSYAGRFRPDLGYIEYCSHEYDVASWEYLRHILIAFPADIVTRAYASALHVLELPFQRFDPTGYAGLALAATFTAAASWKSIRLALFALFVFVYFGGHPAIQFLPRHFFPFECLGWAMAAWAVEHLVRIGRQLRGRPSASTVRAKADVEVRIRRTIVCAAVVLLLIMVPLRALRWYQNRRVVSLLAAYERAPASVVPLESTSPGRLRLQGATAPGPLSRVDAIAALGRPRPRFLDVAIDASQCRPGTTLTFRYDPTYADTDFSGTIALDSALTGAGVTRLFEPVYDRFTGIEVSDPSPSCAPRVTAVNDLTQFALLLAARLGPGWQQQPQYQQIGRAR